jgi:hypothetical protein
MWEPNEFDDLVVVARFIFPYQAHMLAGKLEAEGITAYVHGENFMTMNILYNGMAGGVRVEVKQSDLEAANEILKEIESNVTPSAELPEAIAVDDVKFDLVKGICPECGTASVYFRSGSLTENIGIAAVVLALSVPVKISHKYFCYTCHYEWNG